jgi:ATP-dependent RNA helicase RhlE
MPFRSLGLRAELNNALKASGYTEPTPIQEQAIPEVLRGRDVVGIAQTGTGKTAAFVLPMLNILSADNVAAGKIRALVVVPTRELAAQVEQSVRKYGSQLRLSYATIYGGVGEQPQIAALRRGVDIAIATPGRLLDLFGSGHVDFSHLRFVVLDEADRMLDMGFLPDIRRIVNALPKKRQTLLFSATFSKEIEQTAREFLRDPINVEVSRRASPADTVIQSVMVVTREQKLDLLLQLLDDPALDSVLVFTRTKHGADKVARKLAQRAVTTATLHSNRSQNQRLEALRRFKAGEVRVLVATDIAARGIDVHGISHVINFDFPAFPEDYVHRIGRTGRAQAVGDALSFVMPDEMANLRAVEKFIGRGIPRRDFTPTERSASAESEIDTAHEAERRRSRETFVRAAQTFGHRDAPRREQEGRGRRQGSGGQRPAASRGGERPVASGRTSRETEPRAPQSRGSQPRGSESRGTTPRGAGPHRGERAGARTSDRPAAARGERRPDYEPTGERSGTTPRRFDTRAPLDRGRGASPGGARGTAPRRPEGGPPSGGRSRSRRGR